MTSASEQLLTIQKLQFQDRAAAERLVQQWFARYMDLHVVRVRLLPKAVSLNSFNGFYTIGGEEFFFKTHVEELGVDQEYYNAQIMHDAGYNVVLPLRSVHRYGTQMVIYPIIRWPEVFNIMHTLETSGETGGITAQEIIVAERHECQRLLEIYAATLTPTTADEHAQAPIHQLFWHRLCGGRLTSFYVGKAIVLPGRQSQSMTFEDLLRYRWVINGHAIEGEHNTLGSLIERSSAVLKPERALYSVVGHGDAHFGNVFLQDRERYLYFDPAFAGRHSPLLDIVKPLFHNVFAMWMYFGQDVARDLQLSVEARGGTLYVKHNYILPPVRQAILEAKQELLLKPLLALLRGRGALPDDWRELLSAALLCCPLLTINLLERLPTPVGWLGFAYAMQISQLALREDLT